MGSLSPPQTAPWAQCLGKKGGQVSPTRVWTGDVDSGVQPHHQMLPAPMTPLLSGSSQPTSDLSAMYACKLGNPEHQPIKVNLAEPTFCKGFCHNSKRDMCLAPSLKSQWAHTCPQMACLQMKGAPTGRAGNALCQGTPEHPAKRPEITINIQIQLSPWKNADHYVLLLESWRASLKHFVQLYSWLLGKQFATPLLCHSGHLYFTYFYVDSNTYTPLAKFSCRKKTPLQVLAKFITSLHFPSIKPSLQASVCFLCIFGECLYNRLHLLTSILIDLHPFLYHSSYNSIFMNHRTQFSIWNMFNFVKSLIKS